MTPPPPPPWVFIALGANLGNPPAQLRAALGHLQHFSPQPLRVSSLWESAPVDCPPGSPPFVNAVVGLVPHPGETPESLLGKLQTLERAFGRRPKRVLNEPRPLDLDLIAFGRERRDDPRLVLPHPRAARRAFVLAPLSELEPGLVLPGQSMSVRGLLEGCPGRRAVRCLRANGPWGRGL
ncbi:MAG: 2-amino-4-hydroxy-6-hydroxymethyldihydropteridine diphosphokinase [Verrucomicrobia bacterium]|nr:2-amino-4-hydroxy-6-hydroxymethyldihydropteridine diphosphokinase [Verrucomicrobiota bacterium]